jgi:prolyl oligopeptidase
MDLPPYPPAPSSDLVEDHFGDLVPDPYRPLEDVDDRATRDWIAAQNTRTEQVLSQVAGRTELRRRISDLWDYPKFGVPFERGGWWFQARNSGLQNQPVLYVGEDPDHIDRVLIDPNGLSPDGTVSLTGIEVSPDGSMLTYGTSGGGSDWITWKVREVATGTDLGDVVEWSKFSGAAWRGDGTGFFYGAPERPSHGDELVESIRTLRVMFHRIGTPTEADVEIYRPAEPDWLPHAQVTDDGRYLVITVSRGTGTETHVLIKDLHDHPDSALKAITEPFQAQVIVAANIGTTFYLLTDLGAERSRLVRAELTDSGEGPWAEVIPEAADTLTEVHHCGGYLVCHYLRRAQSALEVYRVDGVRAGAISLPGPVSLEAGVLGHGVVEGRPDSDLLHFKVVSYVESGAIWSHDLRSGATTLSQPSAARIEPDRYVTEQVHVRSADGTLVPMFVTRPAGAAPDGGHRVLLYGYGGFNVALTPAFGITFAAWLEGGGILAVANLRGGGEFGRSWHDAGRLAHKQNVFDDFCACAEWFTTSGWSRPGRIAISGGSNGGLLVGACLTQRPELFGAAVPEVGVLDMLRFHKWTIGWAWKSDFGDPEVEEQYRWLRAYSPLHNVQAGRCYPPTLIMTGDHDDRVVPSHSFKFAAALQAAQGCDRPILLRVETSAGHGLGKPTAKLIDEATDRLAFLEHYLSASE